MQKLPLWAGRTAALLGIVLVALNLRSAVGALSPILDQISVEIPLAPLVLGILGAAPPIAFALAGLIAPRVSRALGLEGSLVVAVVAMVVGQFTRALAPNAEFLLIGTVITLIGAGIGNVLLPPVVKRYFPDRITQVTTLYAVLIAVSTALPALAAVPVANALGWRESLGVWIALAMTALAPWLVATRAHRRVLALARATEEDIDIAPEPGLEGRLFRSPVAWAIMLTFSVSSLNVYAALAWFPTLLVESAHVSQAAAGALLSLYAIMGLPAAVLVPTLAAKLHNVSVLIYIGIGCLVVGNLGLVVAPAAAPVLWIVISGSGALLFPLALVLINARSRTHAGSVALSGFVQGVGYIIAAVSPLGFGILNQLTGGWTASMVFLLVFSLIALPAGAILRKPRMLEDDLARVARAAS